MSDTKPNHKRYRALCEPFATGDVANEALKAFYADVEIACERGRASDG